MRTRPGTPRRHRVDRVIGRFGDVVAVALVELERGIVQRRRQAQAARTQTIRFAVGPVEQMRTDAFALRGGLHVHEREVERILRDVDLRTQPCPETRARRTTPSGPTSDTRMRIWASRPCSPRSPNRYWITPTIRSSSCATAVTRSELGMPSCSTSIRRYSRASSGLPINATASSPVSPLTISTMRATSSAVAGRMSTGGG